MSRARDTADQINRVNSSAADATAITVDSSENVGIGTNVLTSAAQSGKLKVRNDVDYSSTEFEDNATLLLQNETNNHSASIVFHSDNATGSSKRAGIVGGNINSNIAALGLYGDISNKTSATKPDVLIDSSGRVTTPSQPYFSATCAGNSAYTTINVATAVPFNSTARNIGSHFNTSNYRFTAPVAGNYAFSAGVITNSGSPIGRMMFFVNGNQDYNTIKFGISGANNAGGGSTNTSAILHLNANDYVDVRSQSGNMIAYTGGGHSSFTGVLIG